jgi:hypothetical protein
MPLLRRSRRKAISSATGAWRACWIHGGVYRSRVGARASAQPLGFRLRNRGRRVGRLGEPGDVRVGGRTSSNAATVFGRPPSDIIAVRWSWLHTSIRIPPTCGATGLGQIATEAGSRWPPALDYAQEREARPLVARQHGVEFVDRRSHCEVSPAHDTRPVGPQASGNRAVVPNLVGRTRSGSLKSVDKSARMPPK